MEKIYIPGMSISVEEEAKLKRLFKEEGMPVQFLTNEYLFLAEMSKKNIRNFIMKEIDFTRNHYEGVHLICHSMGCNLGIIASEHPDVQSLTLISPELKATSKLERERIITETLEKYQHEQKEKPPVRPLGEQLLLVGLFLRSRKWALKSLKDVDVPIQVFYSEGDPFVSRESVDKTFDCMTRIMKIETSNHNPLLSEKGPELVKQLKRYYGE